MEGGRERSQREERYKKLINRDREDKGIERQREGMGRGWGEKGSRETKRREREFLILHTLSLKLQI